MKIGSLFSAIGGLDLGLERSGLGPVAWQAENDPFCREVLRARWPGVQLFGSVQEVKRGRAEKVEILCGGFPCQPVSVAGARRGADDPRWLWPEFRRIASELSPEWVVIENVPGLRTRGLGGILRDLAGLGFDAEWIDLRASDVGAPHRRARIFIVAHRDGQRLDRWRTAVERAVAEARRGVGLADAERGMLQRRRGPGIVAGAPGTARVEGGRSHASVDATGNRSENLAHGHGHGREREREARLHDHGPLGDDIERRDPGVEGLGDSAGIGREAGSAGGTRPVERGPTLDAGERRERVAFPPRPFDRAGWERWIAAGLPEPVVRGSPDGVPDRLDRLGALGNACVPLVVECVGLAIGEAEKGTS